jgi:hypothetical protein
MSCSLFVDGARCRCLAVAGLHVPTLHERDAFCRTEQAERCPTRLAYVDRGVRLSDEEYLRIWLPPAPRRSAAVY